MKSIEQENSTGQPLRAVDVEMIMAQVREKVQENRRAAQAQELKPRQFVFDDYPEEPTSGSYDSELYAHLRQANQPHKMGDTRRLMRSTFLNKLPIIGSIWRRVQRESHDLVIFYLNSLVNELIEYQRHVAGVLNRLVSWSQAKDTEFSRLREEVKALKERLDLLEAKK